MEDCEEAIGHATKDPVRDAVMETIERLDAGTLRVAEREADGDRPPPGQAGDPALLPPGLQRPGGRRRAWLLVGERSRQFTGWDAARFEAGGFRAVSGSIVRKGAFLAKGVVLTPSFVNIGAYVGEGTMVDTWATVGSCAQIGKHCHLSGGVGIGGALSPSQAK